MSAVTRETDRRSREVCDSVGHFIGEQHDTRQTVEDLARQVEVMRNGSRPNSTSADSHGVPEQVTPEVGVPALLEVEGLKRKVARLTEQVVC